MINPMSLSVIALFFMAPIQPALDVYYYLSSSYLCSMQGSGFPVARLPEASQKAVGPARAIIFHKC